MNDYQLIKVHESIQSKDVVDCWRNVTAHIADDSSVSALKAEEVFWRATRVDTGDDKDLRERQAKLWEIPVVRLGGVCLSDLLVALKKLREGNGGRHGGSGM